MFVPQAIVNTPSRRRSPSPSREVPTTTTNESQPAAGESGPSVKQSLAVQSPDNNVSSMTEDTGPVDSAVTDMANIMRYVSGRRAKRHANLVVWTGNTRTYGKKQPHELLRL